MRLRHQFAMTYATEALNLVCSFAFGVLAARALEAAGRGQAAAAWTVLTIGVIVFGFGVTKALVSRLNIRDGELTTSHYYAALIILLPAQVVASWVLITILFPQLPSSAQFIAYGVVMVAAPVSLATDIVRSIHRARRRIWVINVGTAASAIGRVSILLALWSSNSVTVTSVLMIELGALCLSGGIAIWCLRGPLISHRPIFDRALPAVLSLLKYGIVFQFYSVSLALISRSNVLALSYSSGDAAAGQFAVAARLSEYVGTFANSASLVILPFLAQAATGVLRVNTSSLVCRLVVLTLVPTGVILVLTAPLLVPFLYGPTFEEAIGPLQIMVAASFCATLFQFSGGVALATGKMLPLAGIASFALVLNLLAMAVLIPSLGALGAAWAALFAYACALLANCLYLKFRHGVRLVDLFVVRLDDLRLLKKKRDVAA